MNANYLRQKLAEVAKCNKDRAAWKHAAVAALLTSVGIPLKPA